jgi:hypothetical protein
VLSAEYDRRERLSFMKIAEGTGGVGEGEKMNCSSASLAFSVNCLSLGTQRLN